MPVVTLGVAAGLAVVSPLVMERARELGCLPHPDAPGDGRSTSCAWLAAGSSYRVVSLLAMALGARPRVRAPPGRAARRRGLVAACSSSASLAAYVLGRRHPDGAAAYSGTTAEIVGATLLSLRHRGAVVRRAAALRDLGAGRVARSRARDRSPGPHRVHAAGPLAGPAVGAARHAPDDAWWILGSTSSSSSGRAGRSTAAGARVRSSGSSTASAAVHRRLGATPARAPTPDTGAVRPPGDRTRRGSVGEVPRPREVHRDAGRLRGLDHLGVAHRPTRGHDRADPGVEEHLQPVGEREERVGCRDGTARPLLTGAATPRGGTSPPG